MGDVKGRRPSLLQKLPHPNLDARWEGIQAIMEMSDVGMFDYGADGKLRYANDAWFKLRFVDV
jgi:hypothetical protein